MSYTIVSTKRIAHNRTSLVSHSSLWRTIKPCAPPSSTLQWDVIKKIYNSELKIKEMKIYVANESEYTQLILP